MSMSPAALSRGRSRISNQPTKLAGVDNRSTHGRRRRDLIRGYVAAMGGPDKVSPATMNDVTRAADLVALAEKMRGDALRGDAFDLSDLIRLEGAADRAVRRLAIKPGQKPAGPTLQEYMAAKAAQKAADAADGEAA
jgi:hypothetical protein